jgi:hypothetical protein
VILHISESWILAHPLRTRPASQQTTLASVAQPCG